MALEHAIVRFRLTLEQIAVAVGLLVVALASWWVTFVQFGSMTDPMVFPMDSLYLTVFVSSWTIGMIAMMFPTAVPMMLMLLSVGRRATPEIRAGGGPTLTKAVIFIISYISVWTGVGVMFYLTLAIGFSSPPLNGVTDVLMSAVGVGVALVLVGLYQFSPVKGECLERCHPTNFLFTYYKGGRIGAAQMGVTYAKYCVGCCWVMMLFLLLIGAMGSLLMVLFAGLIFAERTFVHEGWPSRLIGLIFLVAGTIRLLTV